MYIFNKLFIILFFLHTFYTSSYIANITCLSFGKHGCTENKMKCLTLQDVAGRVITHRLRWTIYMVCMN